MKSFGRLLMAAALIVPLGVATAQSAGATQGGQGKFSCSSSDGSFAVRPGLLLGQKKDQRITQDTAVTCTGGYVTGGAAHLNVNEEHQNCASLAAGPKQGSNGIIRVNWSKTDKDGQPHGDGHKRPHHQRHADGPRSVRRPRGREDDHGHLRNQQGPEVPLQRRRLRCAEAAHWRKPHAVLVRDFVIT